MSASVPDFMVEVSALVEAAAGAENGTQWLFSEAAFNILMDREPHTARVCANLLVATGNPNAVTLGRRILEELPADPATDGLRQVEILSMASISSTPTPIPVDVAILTVKPVELAACLQAFGAPRLPQALYGGAEVWIVEHGGTRYAIASVGVDGNVESAMKISRLFRGLDPRLPILVGMAAGVKGAVNLGDVVYSEQVWAVDFEILRTTGSLPRPKTYSPPTRSYANIGTLAIVDRDWATRVRAELLEYFATGEPDFPAPPGFSNLRRLPAYKGGVIFAGSRLIEDNSLAGRRSTEQGRLLAAEMEGAGFAAAVTDSDKTDWLVVRGVADFGEENRRKGWQFASSYAAAALVRDAMAAGRIHLPEL